MSEQARGGLVVLTCAALIGCPGPEAPVDAGGDAEALVVVDAGDGLPTCEVLAALAPDRLMAPAAGSGGYAVPPADHVFALRSGIAAALVGDGSAPEAAHEAGYRLCAGADEEAGLLLWEPIRPDDGQARIVLRPAGAPLIFEAPHPRYDTGTLEESVALFTELDARALIVSGTHRCANGTPSGCDGTTAACGTTAPYVESDAAHAVDSFFQSAHVELATRFEDAVFVSVHGFADDGASVSDGTNDPIAADAPAARLARAMSARFDGVTACSEGAGVPFEERLCGTTNVQGRQLAGVADECTDAAPASSGRFIHMEQSRAIRDDVATVVEAFREAFP